MGGGPPLQVIGLEISTSSAKAILVSEAGEVLAEYTKELAPEIAGVTWQDPEGIYQAALGCLEGIVKQATGPISAIGLAGIWHSLLLLDEKQQPLEQIRTWADLSTAQHLADYKQDENLASDFYRDTGSLIHGMYPIWKLHGLKKSKSPLVSRVRHISSQIEYLFQRFTGERQVSKCTASGSGLFNIHTASWDPKWAEVAGLDIGMLAPLVDADYTAPLSPEVAALLGLEPGIPVTVGCADGGLNQIGSGAISPGVMTLSVGTSGAVRMTADQPLLGEKPETWCYYLHESKRLAGAATHATSNLEWFMGRFGYSSQDHQRLADETAKLPIEDGPFFLPFIFGERAPGWDEERSGGFVGVRSHHSEAHLYKAVLEGILFALYHSYLKLSAIAGVPREIRFSGGILKSKYWTNMAASLWGLPLSTTGTVHESTLGAAILALQACGVIASVGDFAPPIVGTIEGDQGAHCLYQERFKRYLELYYSLKGW